MKGIINIRVICIFIQLLKHFKVFKEYHLFTPYYVIKNLIIYALFCVYYFINDKKIAIENPGRKYAIKLFNVLKIIQIKYIL